LNTEKGHKEKAEKEFADKKKAFDKAAIEKNDAKKKAEQKACQTKYKGDEKKIDRCLRASFEKARKAEPKLSKDQWNEVKTGSSMFTKLKVGQKDKNGKEMKKEDIEKMEKKMKNAKKFGRSAKEGGRPGAVDEDDRKEDGRRMTFADMLTKYKPKDKKVSNKWSKDSDEYKNRAANKVKDKSGKALTKFSKKDPKYAALKTDKEKKEYKKQYKKNFRTALKDNLKTDFKEKLKTYKDSVKTQKNALVKSQK